MLPLLAAAIPAVAGIAGQVINSNSQKNANREQMAWNEKMYGLQKQDNLDFWEKQNTYNSPEQQMQRLNNAGLNPNLVYGNGAVANSTSAPNVPNAMPYTPRVPQFDLPMIADTYFDIASKSQRLSNEKIMGNNMLLENELKQEAIKSAKLNNTFNADTYTSKVRGFLGDNENKYSNSIKSFLNADLLQYLAGQSATPTRSGMRTVSGDPGDSLLVKDWMAKHSSNTLGNKLKLGAIKRNDLDNSLKGIENKHRERLIRGNIEDISAQDWIKMLIQGLGIIPSYKR